MIEEKLKLPLSPPESPLMTDRRDDFDRSILKWASTVEYYGNVDHQSQADRLRSSGEGADTGPLSTTSIRPQNEIASTYDIPPHPQVRLDSYIGCNQEYSGQPRPLQGLSNTPRNTTRLLPRIDSRSTAASFAKATTESQAVDRERPTHIEQADLELSDVDEEEELGQRSVTVAELRAHNRRLKRFRSVVFGVHFDAKAEANVLDKDLHIAKLAT